MYNAFITKTVGSTLLTLALASNNLLFASAGNTSTMFKTNFTDAESNASILEETYQIASEAECNPIDNITKKLENAKLKYEQISKELCNPKFLKSQYYEYIESINKEINFVFSLLNYLIQRIGAELPFVKMQYLQQEFYQYEEYLQTLIYNRYSITNQYISLIETNEATSELVQKLKNANEEEHNNNLFRKSDYLSRFLLTLELLDR